MLHENNELNLDFKSNLGDIFYQVACHQRVQNIGMVTKKILELIPKTCSALERCSGHDGTYGVKQETHKIAVKLARPVAKELNSKVYESFISDCTLAANHIVNVSGKNILPGHPISLLKKAYELIKGGLIMKKLTNKDLLSLEEYDSNRETIKKEVIESKTSFYQYRIILFCFLRAFKQLNIKFKKC